MRVAALRRWVAAIVALATLVAPAGWPLAAQGGRVLPVSICTTAGPAGVASPGEVPADRGPGHDCRQCILCAGSADRSPPGALPARITVPACTARAEAPPARPDAAPATAPTRRARARDPPPAPLA
jgi:hypothetical protein